MRIKVMPENQFEAVRERNWVPVELVGEALPDWAKRIPKTIIHRVMASGGMMTSGVQYHGGAVVPSEMLIGGIDVYRYAPDDPVELNKDWYAVVVDPQRDDMLLVDGPIKDAEHWLNEIPSRLNGIEVLAVPKKQR